MDLQENLKNEQSGRESLNMRESQENGKIKSKTKHWLKQLWSTVLLASVWCDIIYIIK